MSSAPEGVIFFDSDQKFVTCVGRDCSWSRLSLWTQGVSFWFGVNTWGRKLAPLFRAVIRSPYFFIILFLGILTALRVEGDRRLLVSSQARSVTVIQMADRAPASQSDSDPKLEVLLDALESDLSGSFEGDEAPQYSTEPESPLEIEELSVSEAFLE